MSYDQSGLSFMTQGNQMDYNPGQPSQDTDLPDFSTTLEAANHTFRPILPSYREAEQAWIVLVAQNNVAGTITTDIPDLNLDGERWVRALYNAVYDFSKTLEANGSQHYKNLHKHNYYPEGVVQVVLWKLVNNIVEAQRGVCSLPPWYTSDGPVYKPYESFAARFAEVEDALKSSKSCCCGLFSSTEFSARLAWNPTKEFSDGNKVAGRKDIPTALSRSLNDGIKRRPQPSERAKVTSKLIAPPKPPNSEQNRPAPIDEDQPTPLGSPAGSTESLEYNNDEIGLLLSQLSRSGVDTTSGFIGGTDAGMGHLNQFSALEPEAYLYPQAVQDRQLYRGPQAYQSPTVFQQQGTSLQQQTLQHHQRMSQQMPANPSYGQFQLQNPAGMMNLPHISHSGITQQGVNQQHQYAAWPSSPLNMNTPLFRLPSAHNSHFPGGPQTPFPANRGQQTGNSYNGEQGNDTPNDGQELHWDASVFRRQ
ncbi:hypothetical protein E0Z10_g5154 [Xylaria hypoxylon]|uniref:Uncharacterized protein n=1 Tax=Xylaria hypoxylon TaxID=37992 RepID=A0A4Z0YJH4_9PEZI|nr:hypothetical protein E0Z10_g5154 [Xylaria hypoxylon]